MGGRVITVKQKRLLYCISRDLFYETEVPIQSTPSEVIEVFEGMTQSELDLFNILIKLSRKHDKVMPSQGTLAKWIGCSRKTVNRALKRLHELGFVPKFYRHMKTCFYKVSEIFRDPRLRKFLSHLVMAFGLLPFHLLLSYRLGALPPTPQIFASTTESSPTPLPDSKVTQYKELYIKESKVKLSFKEKDRTEREEILQTEREEMNKDEVRSDLKAIPKWVRNVKHIDLTIAGMVYISGFSEEVVEYADKAIATKSETIEQSVYNYFWAICKKKTNELGQDIEWSVINTLKNMYSVTDEEDRVKEDTIINPIPKQTYTKFSKKGPSNSHNTKRTPPVRRDIHSRPYLIGSKKIIFPKSWDPEAQLKFVEDKWPALSESPLINDPRLPKISAAERKSTQPVNEYVDVKDCLKFKNIFKTAAATPPR